MSPSRGRYRSRSPRGGDRGRDRSRSRSRGRGGGRGRSGGRDDVSESVILYHIIKLSPARPPQMT